MNGLTVKGIRHPATLDLDQLSAIRTFLITVDKNLEVTWASEPVTSRNRSAVGRPIQEVLEIVDEGVQLDPESAGDLAGAIHTFLLRGAGRDFPLKGTWLRIDNGFLLAANPYVTRQEELDLFALGDFPGDDTTIERMATRKEFDASLEEANASARALSQKNDDLRVSQESLERTVAELEREVTERQQMEANLMRLRTAIDSVTECVVGIDLEGRIFYLNMCFGFKYTTTLEQAQGETIFSLMGDSEALRKALEAAREESFWEGEIVLTCHNSEFPALIRITLFDNDQFQAQGYMLIFSDLSEQKDEERAKARMEADLLQAQKLESVGQLAAGIAHEINTPIQFVSDNLRFMRDSIADLFELTAKHMELVKAAKTGPVKPDVIAAQEEAFEEADLDYLQEEFPTAVDQSLEGAERVANIVRAMKKFSHPGSSEKNKADLNEAIRTTITIARNEWKYAAELETDLEESLPMVPCLIGEFNQVILNLIVNGRDAIVEKNTAAGVEDKGTIKITTSHDSRWARITVSDSGTGIPDRIKKRIFDPFFTTKEVGKGTGQGLAIAHSAIVDKHGGRLEVESTPGEGTTFIIHLPLEDLETEGSCEEPDAAPTTTPRSTSDDR